MVAKIPARQNHEIKNHKTMHGIVSSQLIGFARHIGSTRSLVQMEKQAKR